MAHSHTRRRSCIYSHESLRLLRGERARLVDRGHDAPQPGQPQRWDQDGALIRKKDGRSHKGKRVEKKANAKQRLQSLRALKKQDSDASQEQAASADVAA